MARVVDANVIGAANGLALHQGPACVEAAIRAHLALKQWSRAIEDVGPGLFTIGVLAIAFGAGFFASAILAYGLSERLGLLTPPATRPTE
jgi:hypothetical protein